MALKAAYTMAGPTNYRTGRPPSGQTQAKPSSARSAALFCRNATGVLTVNPLSLTRSD